MSKVFYDHLVDFSDLEGLIKRNVKDEASRHEIYRLVDEIVHHKVLGCILDKLPADHHKEFLDHIKDHAHDEKILEYLQERISEDVNEFIRHEVHTLGSELLTMFDEGKPQIHKS